MENRFSSEPSHKDYGPGRMATVTKHDTNDLAFVPRYVLVGTAGDLNVTDMQGNEVAIPHLAAGVWHPMRVMKIRTGGAADSIVIAD